MELTPHFRVKGQRWLPASRTDTGIIRLDPWIAASRLNRPTRQLIRTSGAVALELASAPDTSGGLDRTAGSLVVAAGPETEDGLLNVSLEVYSWDGYGPLIAAPITDELITPAGNLAIRFR